LLAADHRVITYDSRGSGHSDRPTDPVAYESGLLLADALAVLDSAGAERSVLVGNSYGGVLAYQLAAVHPERVDGIVLLGATLNLLGDVEAPLARAVARFEDELGTDDGWARYNWHSWRRDFPGFVAWFVDTALGPAASDDARRAGITAGLDTTPEMLGATVVSRATGAQAAMLRAAAARITCPVTVVAVDGDEICPAAWSRAQADALGADPVTLPGPGHCPQVTHPVQVADLIRKVTR
jgi:pimeloyl-ACP methyl ester carboxylesterase